MNKSRCSKCILSSAFPGIDFDEDGVCNFCRDEMLFISEDKIIASSREKIEKLIEEKRGKAQYDAIVCYSGGKDSTYTLQMAVRDYGLKVLSFTLDNGFLAPAAFENIARVLDHLDVDHVTVRPASGFFKSMIKATALHPIYSPKSLTRISAGCNSCISLVNITALKMALQMKTPFIIAGFTLGQIPVNAVMFKNNYRFLEESREPVLKKLKDHVGDGVDEYFRIDDKVLDNAESYPTNLNLLCLKDLSEEEIVKEIEPLGWQRPTDVDGCSSNCRLNTFNNFIHEKQFGYNPYELELSHLIRKGQMLRQEALNKVNDQPIQELDGIMDQLEITNQDLGGLE
jgi:hypothetical protein